MRRYLWPIAVIGAIVLVLGILLLTGVLQGDDTDLERRQEEPRSAAVG
ncbi:hypothetical protein [Nocardioides sp.]|nr:hypothetical protein [Nocardioides sp.]MBJ7356260.1 hypothetical protein [Nocardioides sp.]